MGHRNVRIAYVVAGGILCAWVAVAQAQAHAAAPMMGGMSAISSTTPAQDGPFARVQDRHISPLVGSPAITPRSAGTAPSVPAFQLADAAEYATAHAMPHNLAVGASTVVVSVRFLTSQQVTELLNGESTGVPDSTLLCFVDLYGTFAFAAPRGATVTFHHGFEVFDAHTGNFLMAGGMP